MASLFCWTILWETGVEGTKITSYGKAFYWGVAAFSTAGIADMPANGISQFNGTVWIVLDSMLFFGAIVTTITAYFMRPLQRPSKQIIDTIEYNLEQLDDLTVEELELLKEMQQKTLQTIANTALLETKSNKAHWDFNNLQCRQHFL